MASNIPEFQERQLAQQAVGTPGAALGPSRALFRLGGRFAHLSRSVAVQEHRAEIQAQQLENQLRKQFVDSEVQRMILDQEPVFAEQFRETEASVQNPLDVPKRYGEERLKFTEDFTNGIQDEDIKNAFSKRFLARGIERQGSLTRKAITETVGRIKANAEHELDIHTLEAGNAEDDQEFQESLEKILATNEAGDSAFRDKIGANTDSKVAAAAEQAIENRASALLISGNYEGALLHMEKYKKFIDGDKRLAMTQRARNLQNSQKDLDLSSTLADVKQQVTDRTLTPEEGQALLDELVPETKSGVNAVQATRDRFQREIKSKTKDTTAFETFKETEKAKLGDRVETRRKKLAAVDSVSETDKNVGLPAITSKLQPIFTEKRNRRTREQLPLRKQRLRLTGEPDHQFRQLTDALLDIDEAVASAEVTAVKMAPVRQIIVDEINKRVEDAAADSIAAPMKDKESTSWVAMRLVNETRDEKLSRIGGLRQYMRTLPEEKQQAFQERFSGEYESLFFQLVRDNPPTGTLEEQTQQMHDLDSRALEQLMSNLARNIESLRSRQRVEQEQLKRGL